MEPQVNQHNINMRNRMFKLLKGIPYATKLKFQYDDEGCYSFTHLDIGKKIIIALITLPEIAQLTLYDQHSKTIIIDATITDITAGIGGNVIAYAKYFTDVNAIELNSDRKKMLDANLRLLHFTKDNDDADPENTVHTFCGRGQDIMRDLASHVISFDPPWGGPEYKSRDSITLQMDGSPIEEIINDALSVAFYVVVKLPTNYNMKFFTDNCHGVIVKELEFGKPNSCKILILGRESMV
jgi:hypothetical protein